MKFQSISRIEETVVTEGPMDFARGMVGAMGQKVAQSKPVAAVKRQVSDVIQAGRSASAVGDFSKSVQQLAQLIAQYDHLGVQAEPTVRQTQTAESMTNDADDRRPYTFNTFLQHASGEQVNEGLWDFVKGAGGAIANKARDKISQYAERNRSWLNDVADAGRDIVNSGKAASQAGDAKKAEAQRANAKAQQTQVGEQIRTMRQQVVTAYHQLGQNAPTVLAQALEKVHAAQRSRVASVITAALRTPVAQ